MKYVVDDKKLDAVPFIAFVNQVYVIRSATDIYYITDSHFPDFSVWQVKAQGL